MATINRSVDPEAFHPGWRLYAAFASLAIVNLATCLDAASISTALPVSTTQLLLHGFEVIANMLFLGHNQ